MAATLLIGFNAPRFLIFPSQPSVGARDNRSLRSLNPAKSNFYISITSPLRKSGPSLCRFVCLANSIDEQNDEFLQDLRVPQEWMRHSAALEESEWLRIALHKWLDDEYCPEFANEEISKRCAKVYYYCLMEKQADLGEILMQMVRDLETFSFKESFHGAFSSANAAVHLITKRIQALEGTRMI
eukprot:Gb_23329 [translate_table: standard]